MRKLPRNEEDKKVEMGKERKEWTNGHKTEWEDIHVNRSGKETK